MLGRQPSWRVCGSLFAVATFWAIAGVAHAYPTNHPSNANGTSYGLPAWVGSTCTNCHVSPSGGGGCTGGAPCFNAFGRHYRIYSSWAAIASLDSDGDGVANQFDDTADEGGPGFPRGANEVSCDMEACANAHASSIDCGDVNNFVNCDATRYS
ncbi:MAG: hypothetical protein H6722_35100, partial [Sandaracinus sp.]|nr:hypothetical protein [Sandaracinus sp.]